MDAKYHKYLYNSKAKHLMYMCEQYGLMATEQPSGQAHKEFRYFFITLPCVTYTPSLPNDT